MTNYTVGSGVTSGGITLNAGDVMTVLSGGTASGIIASSGGQETIQSGGVGTATQIRGGQEFVLAGGRVVANVISTGVLNLAGTGSATTVGSGGTEVVSAGGIASNTLVNSGGTEILSGGATSASVVKPGGLEIVASGTATSATVSSGGVQLVLPRGTANLTIVAISGGKVISNGAALFSGTVLVSSSTITLSGQTVGAGETEYVLPHGSSDVAHVVSGGGVNVYSGGTASGIQVSASSFERVSSGGVALATVVSASGQITVFNGGVASSTVLSTGGAALITAGGTVVATVVSGGGTLFDLGMANVTTVNGGITYIESGGQASATVVEGGGQENLIGGSATLTVVSPGGFQMVSSGSVANGTTVSSGGLQTVFSSGTANATVVTAGGTAIISGGGVASGMVVSGGLFSAAQFVTAGGTANATTVRSGGRQYVSSSVANGTTVSSGGLEAVHGGGVASATTLSAFGGQIVSGSGLASNTVISGGFETLTAGGSAIGTVISNGGVEYVLSGGSATLTVVDSGGTEVVSSGGVASATQLNSGGTIDLPNLAFSAGAWADLSPSDVLTVIAGGSGYQQQLSGNYSGEFFQVGADTGSGSLVTLTTTSQTPPTRTLQWIGPQSGGFATASDWDDVTEGFNPALVAPHSIDTAELLSGGGTITGSGTVTTLAFGGSAVWQVPAGAVLSATSGMTVGQSGVGALLINGGASIRVAPVSGAAGLSGDVSGISGEVATVTADGVGTTWSLAGELIVGDQGTGDLSISNAATVSAAANGALPAMALGANVGGTGSLLVFTTGSKASLVGQLDVGQAGDGILEISNRGTVLTGNDAALDPTEGLDVGQQSSGSGQVTVTDKKSLLSNVGRFVVGDAAIGSMAIINDATVITTPGSAPGLAGAVIANTTSADGSSVSVDGSGSNWTVTGTLIVGDGGSGHMQIDGGATVTAGALDLAAGATGDGDVSLAGAGTTLDITGALTLGDQAAGELSILGGAQMSIAGGLVGGTSGAGGNLDIEGSGSQLTINGGTLVVGADGPAEFTLGIGATLSGEVVTDLFGVTNEYGDVDPATDVVVGTQNVGFGSSSSADFYVANSGTIKITSGTATFYSPLATFDTGAQGGSVNGLWVIGAKDTLVMNTTSVDQSQTFDFTGVSAATLVIGQVPQGNPNDPDTFNGQTMPTMTGSVAAGASNVLSGWDAPISNYASGDVITLRGLTYGSATASGDVVTVWSGPAGGGNALGSLTFVDNSDQPSSTDAALAATQINALACFVAGTRIGTVGGWAKVEDLRVGDEVVTVDGRCEPVVWVGSRAVDCARHPKPETVWPVRISAGAFGENVPVRDLYLSPDHAVYVNEVLVPVRLLVNGTSITQTKRATITYYHVELPDHAVILAEGLTVESYLETGHRANFDDQATIRLFPDFAGHLKPDAAKFWETRGAAPLVMAGVKLTTARQGVANPPQRGSRLAKSGAGTA